MFSNEIKLGMQFYINLKFEKSYSMSGLENAWQHKQWHCQEIFKGNFLQEILNWFAGHFF